MYLHFSTFQMFDDFIDVTNNKKQMVHLGNLFVQKHWYFITCVTQDK